MSNHNKINWIKDEENAQLRSWEEFYRNRWQHDKVVRSTHGVNCTGSCTWMIHVKDGIVTWEMQGLDYPSLEHGLPPYEPRGCQRGISFSWYLYSPLRVKYPYIRGALLDLWRKARAEHEDPVEAWKSLVTNPEARQRWQRARGKGGFRRASWDEVLDIMAAANIHTIKAHGPDRIAGFSPIPAMSMVSYASGARLMQLMGGISLSFYDWYCDLPSASPETWGEQTDVQESADWYNAKLLAVMGSNLNMTRTPDCHFAAESRHNGTKMYVFSPDFNQVAKYADHWVSINAGQDGAWWMAVNHVLLKEFHHEKQTPYFLDYTKKYTDAPYLVELTESNGVYEAGQLVRANRLKKYAATENGNWKFLMWDEGTKEAKMPMGSAGFRWGTEKGKWNLLLKDGVDGSAIKPQLTFLHDADTTVSVRFDNFGDATSHTRHVPVKFITTHDGKKIVAATVYDLLMAQYGVPRGLAGDYPADYDDEEKPFTPAWAEKYTGVGRKDLIKFAREWGTTAEHTNGKCTIIIGAGINHWYHANLMYRAGIHALMFCGCIGVNGGGLAHYVGQEKLAPGEPWSAIAFAKDWYGPSRQQNAPSWHYVHTDQWRYEKEFTDYHTLPKDQPADSIAKGHTMDVQVKAVRNGWLPFYPQFNKNPIDLVREIESAGKTTNEEIVKDIVERLKSRQLKFSVEDPDAAENWPRIWYIWRGNALMASSKGHEYFLRHYLGTHDNAVAEDLAKDSVKEVTWHDKVPHGKMDLVVDLNFRMDTSALYSDIVLPAATWYEKADLNSTDMHSFIHPLSAAVPPCWESKSDWDIFKAIAKRFSELAAFIASSPDRTKRYGSLIADLNAANAEAAALITKQTFTQNVSGGVELFAVAARFNTYLTSLKKDDKGNLREPEEKDRQPVREFLAAQFKNHDTNVDKDILVAMILANAELPEKERLKVFSAITGTRRGNELERHVREYVDELYEDSRLSSETSALNLLEKSPKSIRTDEAMELYTAYAAEASPVAAASQSVLARINRLRTKYAAAILEWKNAPVSYPDANRTLRMSYGTIESLSPRDAVLYAPVTTLTGIMEKESDTNEEFHVPAKLKELWKSKDYGRYLDPKLHDVPVAFLSNNDATGGNSGSPVINGNGELIGCLFDGNWEGVVGDYVFQPKYNRSISVDAHYIVFVLDKFSGAENILRELVIK